MTDRTARLDIGCGGFCEPGWIGVDPHFPGAAVSAFAWDLPYDDGEVDAIRASHMLEHMAPGDHARTLAEWYRVLRPGGTLTIVVPDSLHVVQQLLDTGRCEGWPMVMLFGQNQHEGDRHVSAFAPDTLALQVAEAGFVIVKPVRRQWTDLHQQVSIVCEAVRP